MSLTIFSENAGRVTMFDDPAAPALLSLKLDEFGDAKSMRAFITRVDMGANANVHIQHTVGEDIYINIFGDRIGMGQITGLAFEQLCDDAVIGEDGLPIVEDDGGGIGISRVLKFYEENRVTVRETPMQLTLGADLSLDCFLLGIDAGVADPKTRVWQFMLKVLIAPRPLRKPGEDLPVLDKLGIAIGGPLIPIPAPPTLPSLVGVDTDRSGAAVGAFTIGLAAGNGYAAYGAGPTTQLSQGFAI